MRSVARLSSAARTRSLAAVSTPVFALRWCAATPTTGPLATNANPAATTPFPTTPVFTETTVPKTAPAMVTADAAAEPSDEVQLIAKRTKKIRELATKKSAPKVKRSHGTFVVDIAVKEDSEMKLDYDPKEFVLSIVDTSTDNARSSRCTFKGSRDPYAISRLRRALYPAPESRAAGAEAGSVASTRGSGIDPSVTVNASGKATGGREVILIPSERTPVVVLRTVLNHAAAGPYSVLPLWRLPPPADGSPDPSGSTDPVVIKNRLDAACAADGGVTSTVHGMRKRAEASGVPLDVVSDNAAAAPRPARFVQPYPPEKDEPGFLEDTAAEDAVTVEDEADETAGVPADVDGPVEGKAVRAKSPKKKPAAKKTQAAEKPTGEQPTETEKAAVKKSKKAASTKKVVQKAASKKPGTKKASSKKPAAKKTAPKKKTASKKPTMTKAASKKAAPTKSATKKVAKKKPTSKKAAGTKTQQASKKKPASKPAAKKVAVKKPISKKPLGLANKSVKLASKKVKTSAKK